MTQPFMSKQFLIFLITGGIAATINFGSRLLYNSWLNFSTSIVLAYFTGMITAFVLAKIFVFRENRQSIHRSAVFFVLVNLVAVLQTWLISMGLAFYALPALNVTMFAREISHAVGVIIPVFTSYIGHKYWTFSEKR